MPPYSTLVVHGDGPAYYDARNVPHGLVTRHVYHSDVTKGERELYVYTPPGYDRRKTYPVLYLVGGSGDGTLRLDVVDDDTIRNAALIPLGGNEPGNGNFTAGDSYTIDKTAPTTARQATSDPSPVLRPISSAASTAISAPTRLPRPASASRR